MKKVIFTLTLIAALATGPQPLHANEHNQRIVELAVYSIIDYRQSTEMFFEREGYYELNPILGKEPTRQDMLVFGGVGIMLVYLLSDNLPEPWGTILLDSVITSEQKNIEQNQRLLNNFTRDYDSIPIMITIRW